MVSLGNAILYLEKFLAVDIGPGVGLTIDYTGLQSAVDFLERHLLRAGAELLDLRHEYIRCLYPELQAFCIVRVHQGLVGRHLLHAIVPVSQTL